MKKILAITLILVVLFSFVTLSSATSTDHEPIFDGTDLIAATDVDMGTIPLLNESRTFDKQAQLNEIYNRLLTSFRLKNSTGIYPNEYGGAYIDGDVLCVLICC